MNGKICGNAQGERMCHSNCATGSTAMETSALYRKHVHCVGVHVSMYERVRSACFEAVSEELSCWALLWLKGTGDSSGGKRRHQLKNKRGSAISDD